MASTTLEFIKSQRGALKLVYEGYIYQKDKAGKEGKVYWRCVDRRCQGRVTTQDERSIISSKEHNHAGDAAQVEVQKCRDSMKRNAIDTEETLAAIFSGGVAGMDKDSRAHMPTKNTVKRDLRRKRQRLLPPHPKTLAEITIEDEYRLTADGEDWIQVDTGPDDPQRIIIIAAKQSLQRLANADHWFMDGTFKSCPEHFYQLYSIHAMVHNHNSFPLVNIFNFIYYL